MAEVIDYNCLFWLAVAVLSIGLGSLYEKLEKQRANQKRTASQSRQQHQQLASDRRPTTGEAGGEFYSRAGDRSHQFPQANSSSHPTHQERQIRDERQAYEHGQSSRSQAIPSYLSQYKRDEELGELRPAATERTIPTATGFNGDCVDWVNAILFAFFTHSARYGPIISESIQRSLNEKLASITSSSAELRHLKLEFSGLSEARCSQPELTNMRTESESERSVSAICKIYNRRLSLDLAVRTLGASIGRAEQETLNYELTFENLEGKLKSVAMLNDKLIVIQFMEKPDTKILLRPRRSTTRPNYLISDDALVAVILQTLTQVVVDLYFGDDPEFPQFVKRQHQSGYRNKLSLLRGGASEIKRQFKQDFFGALSSGGSADKERKVFVKVLRATNINYNQNVTCLLELDTPSQQAVSSTKPGNSNPVWDEHFLFAISDKSTELLLELWDSAEAALGQQARTGRRWSRTELETSGKFLGLARVNLADLRKNPVQKVALMLETRRGRAPANSAPSTSIAQMPNDLTDSVGGELQVELLFLEHSAANAASSNAIGGEPLQKSGSASSVLYQQGDVVSVDRKLTPTGYVITTTTITKPAANQQQQQRADKSARQVQSNAATRYDQLSVRNQSPVSSATEQSELELNFDGVSSQIGPDNQSAFNEVSSGKQATGDDVSGRSGSRSRSRSRSFLRAIRKRLSFSRTRSRSVGEAGESQSLRAGTPRSAAPANLDRGSMESRSRASSETSFGRAKSVPASRDPSEVPMIVINKGRPSDTASAFTFAHPKSQLVIECEEAQLGADGSNKQRAVVRHYAIPEALANKRQWRKRGTKLHLFNEHQFVACHLAGSSTCHLCGRVFSRRPGKQGYRCRNCHLLSHKQCHVKVDHNCPHAAREGLKLEFIDAEPPESLLREGSGRQDRGASLPRQQRPAALHGGSKSISMDVDDR